MNATTPTAAFFGTPTPMFAPPAPDVFNVRADYVTAAGATRFLVFKVEAFSLEEATRIARDDLGRRTKGRARRPVFIITNEGTTND
jgi:hypothetical protein